MNRSVCEVCRRYEPDPSKRQDVWMCARRVDMLWSEVVPGCSFIKRDMLHYTTADTKMPEWCEHPLEQTILSPEDKVEIRPDDHVVFDGNMMAEHHKKEKEGHVWTPPPLPVHR